MYKNIKNCKKTTEDENNNKVIGHAAAEPRNNTFKILEINRTPNIINTQSSFLLLKIFENIATRDPQAMINKRASETV